MNMTLRYKGFKTSTTLSRAINIKWNIYAKINIRYKTYEDSDSSPNWQEFETIINNANNLDNPAIQSETERFNNIS